MPSEKYQAYPVVDLPARQWPSRVVTHAPVWCSVDLRDGNQALKSPMSLDEKLAFFALLVELGFKQIEVGLPAASSVERDFIRALIERDLIPDHVTIQVMTPSRPELIAQTFAAIRGARRVILHFYNPTSPTQRRVVFGTDRQGIVDLAIRAARDVRERAESSPTEIVFQYSPESSTATELDFTLEICERVADLLDPSPTRRMIVNLPATVEMSTPNVFADRVEWFSGLLRRRDSIVLSLHPHNDRGTAVAAAELGLLAGAERVEGTLFGNGERAGNVDLVTLALNLHTQGVDPELYLSNLPRCVDIYGACTRMPVHPRHPYSGELVYTAFSGSHQDAIRKGMLAARHSDSGLWDVPYLPMDPEDVGRNYEAIIRINSQSGKGGVSYVLEEYFGYRLPQPMRAEFARIVQEIAERTGTELPAELVKNVFLEEYLNERGPLSLLALEACLCSGATGAAQTRVVAQVASHEAIYAVAGEGMNAEQALVAGLRSQFDLDCSVVQGHEDMRSTEEHTEVVAYVQLRLGPCLLFGVGVHAESAFARASAVIAALNRASASNPKTWSGLHSSAASRLA